MSEEITVVDEARKGGWVPKEEYRGDESSWVDAETFVERGRQINPILRANNERLKKEIAERDRKHQAEIDEMKQSVEEFKAFQREASERKVNQLQAELKTLRAARSEATSQEDHEKAAEIDERIDAVKDQVQEAKTVKQETPKPKAADVQEFTPEMKRWFNDNPWYGDDQQYLEETEMVNALGTAIRKKHPTVTGVDFLDLLDQSIQKNLPSIKGNRKGPSVEGGNRTARTTAGKRSYENLPSDSKAACDKFVKQGILTREQYLADYNWDE